MEWFEPLIIIAVVAFYKAEEEYNKKIMNNMKGRNKLNGKI